MPDTAHLTAPLASRYAIERWLDVGGTATVSLAHDLRRDRKLKSKAGGGPP